MSNRQGRAVSNLVVLLWVAALVVLAAGPAGAQEPGQTMTLDLAPVGIDEEIKGTISLLVPSGYELTETRQNEGSWGEEAVTWMECDYRCARLLDTMTAPDGSQQSGFGQADGLDFGGGVLFLRGSVDIQAEAGQYLRPQVEGTIYDEGAVSVAGDDANYPGHYYLSTSTEEHESVTSSTGEETEYQWTSVHHHLNVWVALSQSPPLYTVALWANAWGLPDRTDESGWSHVYTIDGQPQLAQHKKYLEDMLASIQINDWEAPSSAPTTPLPAPGSFYVDGRSGPPDFEGIGLFDTGVLVNPGDVVQISAAGSFSNGKITVPSADGFLSPSDGAYGLPILPAIASNSLVGSVGASFTGTALLDDGLDVNPATGETGADLGYPGVYGPGFVGSSFSATIPAGLSGNIFLAINDRPLGDNSGTLFVTIVTSPPAPVIEEVTGSGWLDAIPLPTEVSTEPEVVGTNLGLALFFALAFGLSSALFNDTLQENEELIQARLAPLLAPLRRAAKRLARPAQGPRIRIARPILLLLLTALLYAFVDPEFGITASGAIILLSLFLALAVLIYSYDGTQALLGAKFFHLRARFRLFPVALAFGVACVLLTRWLDFHPGYLYGFVAGFALLETAALTPRRSAFLVLAGAGALLAVSLAAWSLAVPVGRLAEGGLPGASLLYGVLVAIFVAGLEGLLFTLVPLTFMDGAKVMAWSRAIWGVAFGLTAWLFFHVLINPGSAYLEALTSKKVLLMLGTLAAYSSLAIGTWRFFRWYAPRQTRALHP